LQLPRAVLHTVSAFLRTISAFLRTISAFFLTVSAFLQTISAIFLTISAFLQTYYVHGMSSQDAGKPLPEAGLTLRNATDCPKDAHCRWRSSGKLQRTAEPFQQERPDELRYKNEPKKTLFDYGF
jgi:hypothetical protein